MLNALLGELKTTRGSYHVNGSVAYAPQQRAVFLFPCSKTLFRPAE
jgi:hypothetical protein